MEKRRSESRELLKFIEGKNFSKTIWGPIGKAMNKYSMIEAGDKVAVGISGGKDSLVTLNALVRIKYIANLDFEIIPVHIHPNVDKSSYTKMKTYTEKLGLELVVIPTNLEDILFNENEVKNPCFLCGRIRRGILYSFMKENSINKLALGHHKDDIIETFLMNIFYQGNMKMMKPAYVSEEYELMVIRPLSFVEEKNIIEYVEDLKLPVTKSDCPFETSENSKRLRMKNLIKDLSLENKDVRSVVLNSIMPMLGD